MERKPSTTRHGEPFPRAIVEAVWAMAKPVVHYDDEVRRDAYGKLMARSEYGQESYFGWEIDHVRPVSLGGVDDLDNLQPLHWENNRAKGDDWPQWSGSTDRST